MLAERLLMIRETWNLNQKEMGQRVGVTGAAWQHYEAGQNVPGGKVLVELGRHGINLNWLLLGLGQMRRTADDGNVEDVPIDLERYRRMEAQLVDLGLDNLLLASSLTQQGDEFGILGQLELHYPESMLVEQLLMAPRRSARFLSVERLRDLLKMLQARGLVERVQDQPPLYRATKQRGEMKFTDMTGHSTLCLESVRALIQEVLPRLPPPGSCMLNIRMSSSKAGAARLVQTLKRFVISRCEESTENGGPEELVVVLGAVHFDGKTG